MSDSPHRTERDSSEPGPSALRVPIDVPTAALTVLAALAIIFILQSAQQVLIPIVLAIFVAYILSPLVTGLRRIGLPRPIGAGLAVVLLAGGLGAGVWSITDDVVRLVDDLPRAARQIRDTLRQQRRTDESALQKVHEAASELERAAAEATLPPSAPSGVQRVQTVEPAFRATDYIWWGSIGLVGFAGQLGLMLFLVYFLLAAGDLYKQKLIALAGTTRRRQVTVQILDDINAQIERYLTTLLVTSALVAAVTAAALWWLGLNEWLFWGVAAGVFNTIPYFGPLIVSSGLAVVGLLQFGRVAPALTVAGVALAITSLEGWLITPALAGRRARMNPVAVFIGLLFWSWVWGAWGVILAVPMLAVLKSICDRIETLKPIGELLGD
jgi:predicted PurR-regulated permease PerM